ncbi:hypothetical protein [uncultured Psychroserpens sp.]|uniref:SecDF P1 head subdomain-containing protein n=1 Tax=uncultured Psychroserpens sp. TaxID=255436 RepID=UPI0026235DD3|nr:hypothetical protein [uncultured Psychroserpens sp.]
MKYLYIISITILFLSCGNVKPKHHYRIIYEFENSETVSANDKQGTIATLITRLKPLASDVEVTLNNKQQIEININSNAKLDRLQLILENRGQLDFWECLQLNDLNTFIIEAIGTFASEVDDSGSAVDIIKAPTDHFGALFSVATKDTATISNFLNRKDIRALLPAELKKTKFLFGLPNDIGERDVYGIRSTSSGRAFVNETHIVSAEQIYSFNDRPSISMVMNQKGAQRWERMTEIAYQKGSRIAITVNNIIYSAPTVSSGPISAGKTEITGGFTLDKAQILALVLNSHRRIPKLKFVNSSAIND